MISVSQYKTIFYLMLYILIFSSQGQTTLSPEAQKKLDVVKSCAENKTINVKPGNKY